MSKCTNLDFYTSHYIGIFTILYFLLCLQKCLYYSVQGSFNFWPYQFVQGVGITVFTTAALSVIYYILPVNEQQHKYIPGKCIVFVILGFVCVLELILVGDYYCNDGCYFAIGCRVVLNACVEDSQHTELILSW